MQKTKYTKDSFGERIDSLKSAAVIVPIVLNLIRPKSVVDVGCGTGEFLSVFKEKGIKEILGIDGPWIDKKRLRIPGNFFMVKNLENPMKINKKFDLAISLEVAEHLSKNSAEVFVKNLTDLAPVVLFSAAIPFQGGLYHINEQWPEYWVKLFKDRWYVPVDCIRKRIWNNNEVSFWYIQNTLLFVKKNYLKKNKILQKDFGQTQESFLSIVHPKNYLSKAQRLNSIAKIIPSPLKKIIKLMNFLK